MKLIAASLLTLCFLMVGCSSDPAQDASPSMERERDTYRFVQHVDAGEVSEAGQDANDSGHKCKGLCDPHYGWIYDCEGPPKPNCEESMAHFCHAELCPMCVLTPGQDAGGAGVIGCLMSEPEPAFLWSTQDDAGAAKDMPCNGPIGCPAGSICKVQLGTNVLTGTCF